MQQFHEIGRGVEGGVRSGRGGSNRLDSPSLRCENALKFGRVWFEDSWEAAHDDGRIGGGHKQDRWAGH